MITNGYDITFIGQNFFIIIDSNIYVTMLVLKNGKTKLYMIMIINGYDITLLERGWSITFFLFSSQVRFNFYMSPSPIFYLYYFLSQDEKASLINCCCCHHQFEHHPSSVLSPDLVEAGTRRS